MTFAIIVPDIHLGKNAAQGKTGIGSLLNSRIADQINLLDWILEQTLDCGADTIITTGDVFEDPKPHPTLLALFFAWLKKCQSHNITVHIIMGNHDMIRSGSVFTSSLDVISEADIKNINVYKNIDTIFVGNTGITLAPFRDRKSFNVASNAEALEILKHTITYELATIPNYFNKALIGHFAIEGSIPVGDEIDDISNELFCPIDMFNGYDSIWMGHVHKPQIMNKNNPYIAHVGSMDISNFGETDQKKNIVIVNCDDGSFENRYLPTRALKKISITVPKEIEDPTTYVLNEIKELNFNFDKSIVKMEIALASPESKSVDKDILEKYLTEQGVFNIAGISESKKVNLIKKDGSSAIEVKIDPVSAIKIYAKKHVDPKLNDKFIEQAMEIYNEFKANE